MSGCDTLQRGGELVPYGAAGWAADAHPDLDAAKMHLKKQYISPFLLPEISGRVPCRKTPPNSNNAQKLA